MHYLKQSINWQHLYLLNSDHVKLEKKENFCQYLSPVFKIQLKPVLKFKYIWMFSYEYFESVHQIGLHSLLTIYLV